MLSTTQATLRTQQITLGCGNRPATAATLSVHMRFVSKTTRPGATFRVAEASK